MKKLYFGIFFLLVILSSKVSAENVGCVSSELAVAIEKAIGSAHKIFTSGTHKQANVLGREMLQMENLNIGVPLSTKSVRKSTADKFKNGKTNWDLMAEGLAPVGDDGHWVNLHHIFGEEPGPMAELLGSIHKSEHGDLHSMITDSFRNTDGLETQYNNYRRNYWKERAKQIKKICSNRTTRLKNKGLCGEVVCAGGIHCEIKFSWGTLYKYPWQ